MSDAAIIDHDDEDVLVDVPGARQEPHLGRERPSSETPRQRRIAEHDHEDEEDEIVAPKGASPAVLVLLGVVVCGVLGFAGLQIFGSNSAPPPAQPRRLAAPAPQPGLGQQGAQPRYQGSPAQPPADPYGQQQRYSTPAGVQPAPGIPSQQQTPPGPYSAPVQPQAAPSPAVTGEQPARFGQDAPGVAPNNVPGQAYGAGQAPAAVQDSVGGTTPMDMGAQTNPTRIVMEMPPKLDRILEKQDVGLAEMEQMAKTLGELKDRLAAIEQGQNAANQKFDATTASVLETNRYLMDNTKKGKALARDQREQPLVRMAAPADENKMKVAVEQRPAPPPAPVAVSQQAQEPQAQPRRRSTPERAATPAITASASAPAALSIPIPVSQQWVLRQVSPAEQKAWISTRGSHEDLREVTVKGEPVQGVGQIIAIRQDASGRWVLDGITARIEQP